MTLEESYDAENDRKFDIDGIAVVIDKNLHDELGNVEICRSEAGGLAVIRAGA